MKNLANLAYLGLFFTADSKHPGSDGFVASFVRRVQNWHRARQTRLVLDSLSQEQLKDIGYRRAPGEPAGYERMPL